MFKKFYLSLIAIAAIAALTVAGSLALFSATTNNQNNTFTAGTVTLGAPALAIANIGNIAPGDSGSGNYTITYTGNLEAWLGLDSNLTGALTTCDNANSLQVTITGHNKTFANVGTNQVIGKFTNAVGNNTATLNVAWSLPLDASNECQGDTATITMNVHAVQTAHNDNGNGPVAWQ